MLSLSGDATFNDAVVIKDSNTDTKFSVSQQVVILILKNTLDVTQDFKVASTKFTVDTDSNTTRGTLDASEGFKLIINLLLLLVVMLLWRVILQVVQEVQVLAEH